MEKYVAREAIFESLRSYILRYETMFIITMQTKSAKIMKPVFNYKVVFIHYKLQ